MATTLFKPAGQSGMAASLETAAGLALAVAGTVEDTMPSVSSDGALMANPSLVTNFWAYAQREKLARKTRSAVERKHHRSHAEAHRAVAEEIAELVARLGRRSRDAWCSGCFTFAVHRAVDQRPASSRCRCVKPVALVKTHSDYYSQMRLA